LYEWRYARDKLFAALITAMSILAVLPLFHVIAIVVYNGSKPVLEAGARFLVDIPPTPLSKDLGGVGPALVGSFLITLISMPITIMLALLAAILENEFPHSRLSKTVDALSRSLASVPTIIVSMVVYSTLVVPMRGFSALAGATALTLVSFPYAYTAFTSALGSVPRTYREAAYAIGINRWKTVFSVFIPIARKAIVAGILLTFARAMGETAALFFTVGRYRSGISLNPLSPTDALPLLIFDFITSPFRSYHEIAWGASFVLFVLYLAIFITVKTAVKEVRL